MFFTAELLERRDSGFGLLWLAATLGAKSSFKKLPKRSVLTADISQLCDLIAEPNEPLALRLSSNLMIGVARVYKVKQEIFLTDVTTCFHSLKKAVQDVHALARAGAELQMGQPSLRPDALNLVADPSTAFAMDFDNLLGDWEEIQRGADKAGSDADDSDDEFNPKAKKGKQKQKFREKPSSLIENPRGNLHTLEEHHVHLLSGSFDESFNDAGLAGLVASSSQFDGGFGFADDVFGLPEGLDVAGEIGDELARELGEGWGGSPARGDNDASMSVDPFQVGIYDGGLGLDFQAGNDPPVGNDVFCDGSVDEQAQLGSARGNIPPMHSVIVPLEPFSPIHEKDVSGTTEDKPPQKKAKRVRLLLDARTELTDEELKIARANYMEGQDIIRRSINQKKLEKESAKLIEEMIWGVPQGVQAPVLVDFWLENFQLQVEARSGALHVESHGEPPTKRRRIEDPAFADGLPYDEGGAVADERVTEGLGIGGDVDFPMGEYDFGGFEHMQDGLNFEPESRLRSSETPGQARRASRAPSILGSQFDLDLDHVGSQRSALFPWDNAGVSSSVNGATLDFVREGSARFSFGRPELRTRASSLGSRRESSLLPGRFADSPAALGHGGEAFEFDVSGEDPALLDSQQSDMNLLTLERNSFNFLEYAKMQLKTFPTVTSTLAFNDVVPKLSSTPHVAAAAFYHCLVLATKDLVGVAQDEPYGTLKITVK